MSEKRTSVGTIIGLAAVVAAAAAGGIAAYTHRAKLKKFAEEVMAKAKPAEEDGSVLTADLDEDGTPDIIMMDTTGDGQVDTILMDTTGDGQVDSVAIDLDGDGTPDIMATGLKPEKAEGVAGAAAGTAAGETDTAEKPAEGTAK